MLRRNAAWPPQVHAFLLTSQDSIQYSLLGLDAPPGIARQPIEQHLTTSKILQRVETLSRIRDSSSSRSSSSSSSSSSSPVVGNSNEHPSRWHGAVAAASARFWPRHVCSTCPHREAKELPCELLARGCKWPSGRSWIVRRRQQLTCN